MFRTPPRFVTRTLIATLATVAFVLSSVLFVVTLSVRKSARDGVVKQLETGQRLLGALEDQRAQELQSQLDRDQTYIEAMQTRVNSLTADLTNRDDPAQRAVIATDRQKSLTELERLKGVVEQDKKAITDFNEEEE